MSRAWLFLAIAAALAFVGCGKSENPDPLSYPVQGIDVSRHQGDIDWAAVGRSGIRFAWIKATEGGDHLDVKFRRNWELARTAGVRRGAYHFVYWCRAAAEQASWFVANVPNDPDALPPVLDLEWTPQSKSCGQKKTREDALPMVRTILAAMRKAYGRRPLIYTTADFYRDILAEADLDARLWLRSLNVLPGARYDDRDWAIWQYSETGSVAGITGPVDRNCFNGSVETWRAWLRRRSS